MAATAAPPRLLPSGDSAITVEFSRNIDDAANQRVLALDRALPRSRSPASPKPCRPIARCWCIMIPCKSISTRWAKSCSRWRNGRSPATTRARRWRIPVAYGGEHGIDLEDVAKTLEHHARRYRGAARRGRLSRRHDRLYAGLVLSQRARRIAAHAAAAESAAADAGRHDLDRRRADRRAMPGRPERLASARTNRRPNLPVAPRSRSSCWSPATTSPSRPSMPRPLPSRTAPRKPARSSPN